MSLTEQQIERYSRQILLPEIGGSGQQRLLNSGVAILGSGEMAKVAACYLAGAGIGRLVMIGNLDRLPIQPSEITALNPDVHVETVMTSAESQPIAVALLCDSPPALFSQQENMVMLVGQSHDQGGWYIPDRSAVDEAAPCLACALPEMLTGLTRHDVEASHPLFAGWIGTLLATEAIKTILGSVPPLKEGLRLQPHQRATPYQRIPLHRLPECPNCGPIDSLIDITAEICPMTLVHVKLKLETLPKGSRLRILLKGKEPLESLPQSLHYLGHALSELKPKRDQSGVFMLDVRSRTCR